MATTGSASVSNYPLSIKEVLEVLLLCFDAAANALPPFPFAYAKFLSAKATPTGIPSFIVWSVGNLDEFPPTCEELAVMTFPPESLLAALARLNMCDYFAILVIDEAQKLMREYFDAQVSWNIVIPVPDIALFPCYEQDYLPFLHSVLAITEASGEVKVMDGTPEQFHWDRSTWLLPDAQFRERILWPMAVHPSHRKPLVEEAMRQKLHGYWAIVQGRMNALFDSLDWSSLCTLLSDDRVALVKAKAELAFAGAWREARQSAGHEKEL